MKKYMQKYIDIVEAITNKVGLVAMYLIFVMIAILFYSSISKTFFEPSKWTLEISQFLMMAYFVLGGGYSLKENGHVRMDLFYDRLSPRAQDIMDAVTLFFLVFYLLFLLVGGIDSTLYALEYGERSYSSWAPYMAPIKILLTLGIFLTLLQAIAMWFRDILNVLPGGPHAASAPDTTNAPNAND
ncbi:MAG: C4-dicarboxylate ABC transporter permease [Gammaproteobacteria bacterium]|nr:MAG: C4-dicarboxylate ABC transporter permease [Gammaproteobacteria bacterium]